MQTIFITQEKQIISTDAYIIDNGEVENSQIIIEKNCRVDYTFIPKNSIANRHICLNGENIFRGKWVVVEDGEFLLQTEIFGDHVESGLEILAIATDNSKISLQGEAKVDKPYKKLNVRVDQTNILIGENTVVRGVPRLEIATNDIEGGHSCKIHRLGGDALFYLQTHGLDTKQSEVLLLNSEILKHLDTLPEEEKENICSSIHTKLFAKNK